MGLDGGERARRADRRQGKNIQLGREDSKDDCTNPIRHEGDEGGEVREW